MFALCIESSHSKGMGHLYRALNFIEILKSRKEDYIVFVNEDPIALGVLKSKRIQFEPVDLADYESNWESRLINKYHVDVWVNDRLDTDYRHSKNIKKNGIKLVTFDDKGSGLGLSDINVAALAFAAEHEGGAGKTLKGIEYLILSSDIAKYRRLRKTIKKIVVTLGGSDTYGVTVKVVKILREIGKKADIHIGPSFKHHEELKTVIDERYRIMGMVPSLIEVLYDYDLAITGGGITPFEANAAGLPCLIIANEPFEIDNGRLLEKLGSSVFAGYHKNIDSAVFMKDLDIERMSHIGMASITLNGAENVYSEIRKL